MNTRIGVHQLRLQRAKAAKKKKSQTTNCLKRKYTIKYCCPNIANATTLSTATDTQNCSVITCGGRTVYFRQFAPTSANTAVEGDIWFDCSQNPSTQYIFRPKIVMASDANGNLYSVNVSTGSGTQISSFAAPYDGTSPAIYYPPYANCDVVIDPITKNGYVFGIPPPISSNTTIITEFNSTTLALTGRTATVPFPPGITQVRFLFISAAAYISGRLILNVFLLNNASGVFGNYIYQLNPVDLTITYLGRISIGFVFVQIELISGITFDEITGTIYAVTNYNDQISAYTTGNLYTLNLTTFQATLVAPLTFPGTLSSDSPVAQSLNKYDGIYYVGMCSKPLSGLPAANNFSYLLTLDVATGVLTLVDPTLTNTVVPNASNGGVVGLTSINSWNLVSLPT